METIRHYSEPKVQRDALKGVAKRVYQQLITDFPAPALEWVKQTHWEGPMEVPIDQIDTKERATWAASHEPQKVKIHMDLIKKNESAPIILAKIPDNPKFVILDAHHRFLGYEALGKNPIAYIAYPSGTNVEAALTMHSKQYRGRSKLDGV